MQVSLETDLFRLGIKLLASCLFLFPSISHFRQNKSSYHKNKEKLALIDLSHKAKNSIEDSLGSKHAVISLHPKQGSLKKSFKYTYYSYEPEQKQNYTNVSGSIFYANSRMTQPQGLIKKGDEIIVDLRCFSINKSALIQQIKPLNPKNLWSDMLDSSLKKGYTLTNQYSLNKIQLTLKLTPLVIFGQIKIDQIRNIPKLIPEYIANTYDQIVDYYQSLTVRNSINTFLGGALIAVSLGVIYLMFKDQVNYFKKRIHNMMNKEVMKSEYVLSDPADKLYCKTCKERYSNVVLECSHLSVCMECYEKDKKCPQCGVVSRKYTKIFV